MINRKREYLTATLQRGLRKGQINGGIAVLDRLLENLSNCFRGQVATNSVSNHGFSNKEQHEESKNLNFHTLYADTGSQTVGTEL